MLSLSFSGWKIYLGETLNEKPELCSNVKFSLGGRTPIKYEVVCTAHYRNQNFHQRPY